jgi:hypothetical protein
MDVEHMGGPELGTRITLANDLAAGTDSTCPDGHIHFDSELEVSIGFSAFIQIQPWKKDYYSHQFPPFAQVTKTLPLFSGCANIGRRLAGVKANGQPIETGTDFAGTLLPKSDASCKSYPTYIDMRCAVVDDDFNSTELVGQALGTKVLSFGCTQSRRWEWNTTNVNVSDKRQHQAETSQLQYLLENGDFQPEDTTEDCKEYEASLGGKPTDPVNKITDPNEPCFIYYSGASENLPIQLGDLYFKATLEESGLTITQVATNTTTLSCFQLPLKLKRAEGSFVKGAHPTETTTSLAATTVTKTDEMETDGAWRQIFPIWILFAASMKTF